MSNIRTPDKDQRRSLSPWWLVKLAFFFAVAMGALSSVAAFAEEGVPEENNIHPNEALGNAPKPYRQRALIALLANERRSIDQRIERVMRELERIDLDRPPEDVQPALTKHQRELLTLERRLGEIEAELTELNQGPDAKPTAEEDVRRTTFIPASRPRLPDEAMPAEGGRYPRELRRRIQEALIFSGGYDSTIDGNFGKRTEAAIRRYQSEISAEPTGRLSAEQVERLLDAATDRRQDSELQPFTDDDIGFRLTYPSAFLTRDLFADSGYRIFSDDSGRVRLQIVAIDSRDLRTLYDDLTRHAGDGYRHITETWFVASGETGGDMFYAMGRRAAERSIIAHLTYPSAERERWDPFTVILYNSFELTGSN